MHAAAVNTVNSLMARNTSAAAVAVPTLLVTVTEPFMQGEGISSYITYKVGTKTSLPQYAAQEFHKVRRYSDFAWLHNQLKYPNVIIPPLPEKAVTGNTDPNFVALRRHGLERFLRRVVEHPVLQFSNDLQTFLEADETTLNQVKQVAMDLKQQQIIHTASSTGGISRWFKEAFQSASNTWSAPEEFADPQFDMQKLQIEELKERVTEVRRHARRLVQCRQMLAENHVGFADQLTIYSEHEEGETKNALLRLGSACRDVGVLADEHAGMDQLQLESVLSETVGYCEAVQQLSRNREKAIVKYQTSRSIHQEKVEAQGKNVMCSGNPGKVVKAASLIGEIHDALVLEDDAKRTYDDLVASMKEEITEWEKLREDELKQMMLNFAQTSKEYYAQTSIKWDEAYKQIHNEFTCMGKGMSMGNSIVDTIGNYDCI